MNLKSVYTMTNADLKQSVPVSVPVAVNVPLEQIVPIPALHSKVVWGSIAIVVPYLDQIYQYLAHLPAGVLPQPVAIGVTGLGLLLVLYGRVFKANPPIIGVLKAPVLGNIPVPVANLKDPKAPVITFK